MSSTQTSKRDLSLIEAVLSMSEYELREQLMQASSEPSTLPDLLWLYETNGLFAWRDRSSLSTNDVALLKFFWIGLRNAVDEKPSDIGYELLIYVLKVMGRLDMPIRDSFGDLWRVAGGAPPYQRRIVRLRAFIVYLGGDSRRLDDRWFKRPPLAP